MKVTCTKCNKEFHKLGIGTHSAYCGDIKTAKPRKPYIPWNKGLTKEASEKIARCAKEASERMIGKPGTKWTDDMKEAQRQRKIALYKKYPEKHPNRKLAGNASKMSFPEHVCFEWLVKNKISFEHQFMFNGWYIDFKLDNLLIEIDGEYWHDAERDRVRDEVLLKNGYSVYRIKANEHIEGKLFELSKKYPIIFSPNDNYTIPEPQKRKKKEIKKELYKVEVLKRREEYNHKIDNIVLQLKESDIDFTKYGWVEKASKIIGITPQKTSGWVKKNSPDLFEKCFKRNQSH